MLTIHSSAGAASLIKVSKVGSLTNPDPSMSPHSLFGIYTHTV